jgi:hypothetical protein
MILYDEDGSRWEVDDDDCDCESDEGGCWLYSEDGSEDDWYDYCDDEGDDE